MKRKVLTILLMLTAALGLCFALAGCDSMKKRPMPHVHEFTGYSYNNDATCTEDGTETGRCECGETDTRTVEGTSLGGHDLEFHEGVEPTCSESGTVDYYTCRRCDYQSVEDIYLPALHVQYRSSPVSDGYEHVNGYIVTGIDDACDHSEIAFPSTYMDQTVIEVDGDAIRDHTSLKKIILPDSLTEIYWDEFYGCASLESVVIPDSVTMIGGCSFSFCTSLKSINIPEHVREIGPEAFYGCTSLESIEFPDSVTLIEQGAFTNCTALKSLSMGKGVKTIGIYAFEGCSIDTISITDLEAWCNIDCASNLLGGRSRVGKPALGTLLLNGEPVTDVVIPKSVERIRSAAFQYCSSLTSVRFEAGSQLTTVAQRAFLYCEALKSVEFPDGVTSIGFEAFAHCSSLKSVTLPEGLISIEDSMFYECASLESVNIPSGVTSIEGYAFCGCRALTHITFPESLSFIDRGAFYDCDRLVEIWNYSVLPIEVQSPSNGSVGWGAKYIYTGDEATKQVGTEDGFVFFEDEEDVFLLAYHGNEENLTLPKRSPGGKKYKVYKYAFHNCTSLKSVTTGGATELDPYAFCQCSSLVSVTISDDTATVGERAFNACDALEKINVSAGNPNYRSEQNCLIDKGTDELVIGCKASVIPVGVTAIHEYAFSGCSGLESIVLPDSVTKIGDSAFEDCTSLKSIEIPDSVTEIEWSAFCNCTSLKSIILPKGMTSIALSTFEMCTSLESIIIPEGVSWIGVQAFGSCSAIKSIALPSTVTMINDEAFYGCGNLTSITISDNVTRIGTSAFGYCEELTEIRYLGTVESWQGIRKGSNWDSHSGEYTVTCTDGTIDKAGNVTYFAL